MFICIEVTCGTLAYILNFVAIFVFSLFIISFIVVYQVNTGPIDLFFFGIPSDMRVNMFLRFKKTGKSPSSLGFSLHETSKY